MAVEMFDSKVVALFEKATLGKNYEIRMDAERELKSANPAVAGLLQVYRDVRSSEREHLVTHQAVVEKYAPLFDLAKEWSAREVRTPSPQDIELAVFSLHQGGSKQDIVLAMTGVTHTRVTLIQEVNATFNQHQNPTKLEEGLSRLTKMDPELALRLKGAVTEADAHKNVEPITSLITDIYQGKYDTYGLSKAAYDFDRLARMETSEAGYQFTLDAAIRENSIIGPYLMQIKRLERQFALDGDISAGDEKALKLLQKGFADSIRAGVEMAPRVVREHEAEALHP